MTIHEQPMIDTPTDLQVPNESETILDLEPPAEPNPLFRNLTPELPATRDLGRLSFADAMPRMGMRSVFDIIRQPKQAFTRQLRTLSDADGEMAYENAMCYATQIARSFRDDVVSSGRSIAQTSQRSGVRALVDIGPSYPNLFRENWDEFCKVGAIEAMDGPVAYLGSLRRFAEREIEDNADGQTNITLAIRRPDLDALVIDERSTYQPVPMLDLVNDVLTQGIDKYQKEKNDVRPIHTLLAEKKHPFVFPYHFAHQQATLALAAEKPGLGVINHRLATAVPFTKPNANTYTSTAAQHLLTGLSPAQQKLLTAPSLFPTFTVGALELDRSRDPAAVWISPTFSTLYPHAQHRIHLVVPNQPGVTCTPAATSSTSTNSGPTLIELKLSGTAGDKTIKLDAYLSVETATRYPVNYVHASQSGGSRLHLYFDPAKNTGVELSGDYAATFSIDIRTNQMQQLIISQWRIHIDLAEVPQFSTTQQDYLLAHLGMREATPENLQMADAKRFCDQTGIDSEQLEALIGRKSGRIAVSPNWRSDHSTAADANPVRRLPYPSHFGASYVNGNGAKDWLTGEDQGYDNAMDLVQLPGSQNWIISNLSPDRLDRMQRMVRLQKWLDVPFDQLDTLVMAAIRGEFSRNPRRELNANTLRALGVFRHLQQQHGIGAEEFAAFMDGLNPFCTSQNVSLFDRVFNSPVRFDEALVLDGRPFSLPAQDTGTQKLVEQLRAGLQVSERELTLMANNLATLTPTARSSLVMGGLFRQARIAAMFGLSVTDCSALLKLLGPVMHEMRLGRGELAPRSVAPAAQEADILDILMELDWAVRWLKDNKLSVQELHALLSAFVEPLTANMFTRLQKLSTDAHAQRVTPASIKALALPVTDQAGRLIDWVAKLQPSAVLDANGLVPECTLTLVDTTQEQLQQAVTTLIGDLDLHDEVRAHATDMLADFLVNAATAQARLSEACLQELTGLLPELALLAARSTALTPHGLLLAALQAWPNGQPVEAKITALGQQIGKVLLMAQTLKWSHTGARALRTFVVKPSWLGSAGLWPQSLHSLHLLKAYDTLFNTLGQPEERLLDYLEQANTSVSKRPGKRQLAVQSQACNADLASLLGWSETEVAVLTALLPQGIAKTVAHVDWLRRAQAVALETGLSTATLVQACALTADSPEADWQAVGQAAMAAAV